MGATRTQSSTLLVLLVLTMLALRPQVQVYMHGRLETRDKATTTTATVRLPRIHATTAHIHRQPFKPVFTGAQLTSVFFRLTAGASQFFDGALLVEPRFAPAPEPVA